jgi:hypothetical protein
MSECPVQASLRDEEDEVFTRWGMPGVTLGRLPPQGRRTPLQDRLGRVLH